MATLTVERQGQAAVLATSLLHMAKRLRSTPRGSKIDLSFWAMHLAHIGLAITAVGITLVSTYETENDVRMAVGESVQVGDYRLTFKGVHVQQGPNYTAQVGNFDVAQGSHNMPPMHPEKRTYVSSSMPMTEAAIDSGFTRDVYVSLGEALDAGTHPAWSVRVYYKPFVNWIWWGALFMALGGILATLDRRYRKRAPMARVNANSSPA